MHTPSLRIAILVTDANERSSFTRCDPTKPSPVLHPAEESLLLGLRDLDGIEIEIIYAKAQPEPGDFRRVGNCSYHPVPYRAVGLPGMRSFYLGRLFALLKYLRSSRHDLIHAQGTERECGLAACLASGPSVITLHGNLNQIAKTVRARRFSYFWTAALLETFAVKRVSAIHCISSHAQACVKPRAKQTHLIPNSVAPVWYQVTRQPSPTPFVTCIADITEWKNQILLAKASDSLHAAFPAAEVHFYGACNEMHPYGKELLEVIRSRPWCVFHGKSSTPALVDALTRATCAVLPSKQENFGLALAEAMAAGVPVLGANVGGIPDVIHDTVTGRLFDPDDAEALGQLLVSVHSDPSTLARMAAAGRQDATTRFSIQAVAEAHLRMYHQLVIPSR